MTPGVAGNHRRFTVKRTLLFFFPLPLSRPFHFLHFATEARCPASVPFQSSIPRQGRVASLRSCNESKMNPIISHVHTRASSARFPFCP